MFDPDQWLEIGKIVSPQGLQGEMRVYPNTDFPERFLEPGERWLLRHDSQELESVNLLKGRFLEGKGLYVIQLDGILSREHVEDLRNSRLWVPASDRPALGEGEFHVADLIGLRVYDQGTDEYVGYVTDILTAGNDLLEVELVSAEPQHYLQTSSQRRDNHNLPAEQRHDDIRHKKSKKRSKSKDKNQTKTKTALIPFVYDIVPVVDIANQRIEIRPPKGLI